MTIHDVITVSRPEWCAWHNVVHYRMAMTYSARRADAVIAPSEFAGREVVEHLGVDAGRVHVAPLGVNARFRPATAAEITRVRERYRLPERYLLCVGNVEPRKNLTAVVAAFERLPEEFPHALVIAGKRGWKCTEACRAMEHSSRAGRIRRLGWVAEEDLPALYSGADLLVQWSRHEGFGLTPLEAMACGTVAVVSDAGALPETAGEAAAVVPLAAGPEGLAAEIARLLRSESERGERSARSRACREIYVGAACPDRGRGLRGGSRWRVAAQRAGGWSMCWAGSRHCPRPSSCARSRIRSAAG